MRHFCARGSEFVIIPKEILLSELEELCCEILARDKGAAIHALRRLPACA
jgi:hypothetical protein